VTARVEGVLKSVDFEAGREVKEGDLLFTLDDAPLKASVDAARAALSQAEAASRTADREYERVRLLLAEKGISEQEADAGALKAATAAANVLAARAALDQAELALGYARIAAPIAGIAGNSSVSIGNLVGRGQATLLTTIVDVDPIHVKFSVDEKFFLETIRQEHRAKAPSGIFQLALADGNVHPERGDVVFVDNKLDRRTGTILVEVAFPNPGNRLRPGLFARVQFPREKVAGAIVVPQRAVQEMQATYSVFVVTPENTAEVRPVTIGARLATGWIIRSGLASGDKVVVEGVQKLRPGAPVVVLPSE
jgi:membrane fusion protein, multidrug efflux system